MQSASRTVLDWESIKAKPVALGGYTTLLNPDPKGTSGQLRGFFSGKFVWFELSKSAQPLHIKSHYVTIRGHFAVPEAK
jgi:hypothetical protein